MPEAATVAGGVRGDAALGVVFQLLGGAVGVGPPCHAAFGIAVVSGFAVLAVGGFDHPAL